MSPHTLIIDFDSTFIQTETLEELAQHALQKLPQQKREKILQKIAEITKKGMEGAIPFSQSLQTRLTLFSATKQHVKEVTKILSHKITPSIKRNLDFFIRNANSIYILSSGFKKIIIPIVKPFGISKNHVFANTLIYNTIGNITGVDTTNPLTEDNGKTKVVASLNLPKPIYMLGDGYTDYLIKEAQAVDYFFAFVENVYREQVVAKADYVLNTFDEFIIYAKNIFP